MEEMKKTNVISKIVGVLVESESSALEAIEVIEKAKQTFLERCWHICSSKKGTSDGTEVESFLLKSENHIRCEKCCHVFLKSNKYCVKCGSINPKATS